MTPKLAEEPGTMEVGPASVEEPEWKRLRPPADQDAEVAISGVGAANQSSRGGCDANSEASDSHSDVTNGEMDWGLATVEVGRPVLDTCRQTRLDLLMGGTQYTPGAIGRAVAMGKGRGAAAAAADADATGEDSSVRPENPLSRGGGRREGETENAETDEHELVTGPVLGFGEISSGSESDYGLDQTRQQSQLIQRQIWCYRVLPGWVTSRE